MAINVGTLEAILKLRDEMSPSLKGAIGNLVKAGVAMVSFAAAAKLVTSALAAQAEKEAGINKLNLALANQGRLSGATSKSLVDYASALQDVSTFSAGAILSAEGTLAQFGLNEEQIKATTEAALDFAAATGKELPDAIQNLTAGIMGQGRAFKAYGIDLEDTGSKTKNLEQLLGQLENKFGGSAAAATKTYTGQLSQLRNAFSDAGEGLGKLLGEVAGADKPFSVLISIGKWLSNFFGVTLVIALSEARAQFAEFVAAAMDLGAKAGDVLNKITFGKAGIDSAAWKLAAEDQRKLATEMRAAGDAAAASEGKTQSYKNAAKTTFSDITAAGREAAKKAAEEAAKLAEVLLSANKAFHDEALKTWDEWGKRADQNIDNVVSEYMRLSSLLGPTLGEVEAAFKDLNTEVGRRGGIGNLNDAELRKFISGMEELGDTGKLTSEQFEVLGDAYTEAMERGIIATEEATDATLDFLDATLDVTRTISDAVLDIGSAFDESFSATRFGRILSSYTDMVEGTAKFAKGILTGDVSSIISGAAQSIVGTVKTIQGIFGGADPVIMEVNDLRDAFFEAQGGFVELQKKLQGLTNQDLVKKIFDARTVEDFDAAVAEASGLLSFVDSAGGIDALKLKAKEAGVSLDEMFQAKSKDALLEAIDQVKDKLDTWNEANEELQAAIDKYGFSIEELGPKYRQQELDKMAAGLLQDFKLLTASGIDQTLVISKMGPAMNDYVQTALRAGAQIPIAMKPQIDAMIAAGQLLDANGNAYASAEAAGITYAQTMSDMFTQLMDRVGQLVNALLGIPDVTTTVTTVHEEVFREGGGGEVPQEDFAAAAGFHGMVSRPTRILAGEAGPERVDITPRGQRAPGSSTSVTLSPTFNIDPLQSNAGRADLGKFLMQQFFREARNSPMLRQVLREGGR